MKLLFKGILIIFALSIVFTSCKKKEKIPLKPAFSSIYENIFEKKCALYTCHSSAFYKDSGNLDFSTKESYFDLVNVASFVFPERTRVLPKDPDKSLLINRLEGTVIVSVPLERNTISDHEIGVIREWVKLGALND